MAGTFRARVRAGRLVLDEPTELPDGTEVELIDAAEVGRREGRAVRVGSPRLAQAEDVGDFELVMSEDAKRAGI